MTVVLKSFVLATVQSVEKEQNIRVLQKAVKVVVEPQLGCQLKPFTEKTAELVD